MDFWQIYKRATHMLLHWELFTQFVDKWQFWQESHCAIQFLQETRLLLV